MLTSLLAIVCFVSFFLSFVDLVVVFGCSSSVVLQRILLHTLVLKFGHIQRLPKPLLLSGFSSSCDLWRACFGAVLESLAAHFGPHLSNTF